MKTIIMVLVACCSAAFANLASAECPYCNGTGCCYKEVVSYRCVKVPEEKPIKKVFYECKVVPFCHPALPGFLCDDCCTDCACPRFKHVLVKREVEVGKTCGTKCVIEEFVEHVQVPCCHCDCCESDPDCDQGPAAVRPVPPAEAYRY